MPRFFRNGKCWPFLLAVAALPSAAAWPTFLEPALPTDSVLPETVLSDAIETARPPEVDGILVGRLVNLTLDYASQVDPQDNVTEQQRKAQDYLHAMELVIKEFVPPGVGWCVRFVPSGPFPGPGRTHVHDAVGPIPIGFGRYVEGRQQGPSVICD